MDRWSSQNKDFMCGKTPTGLVRLEVDKKKQSGFLNHLGCAKELVFRFHKTYHFFSGP